MAKKLLRLNVVVTPEQHRLLAELGQLQGRSSASFLREMLDAAEPFLKQSLTVWQEAAKEAAAQPDRLRAMIIEAIADVKGQADQLDMIGLIMRTAPGANDPGAASDAPSVARAPKAAPAVAGRSRRRR